MSDGSPPPPALNRCHLIPLYYLFSVFVFFPSPFTLSGLSFFCLLAHSPDFFLQKMFQYFSLRDRLVFGMAPVQQLGEISWSVYVQHAAIWHWYLLLCTYMIFIFCCCFCSFPFLCLGNLVLINRRNCPRFHGVLTLCVF